MKLERTRGADFVVGVVRRATCQDGVGGNATLKLRCGCHGAREGECDEREGEDAELSEHGVKCAGLARRSTSEKGKRR